jgi:hypothetical protein
MPIVSDFVEVYIESPAPNYGDALFRVERDIRRDAGTPAPTDAELVDIGNRLLASDYIQNQAWGSTAALVSITVPSQREVYP